MKDTEGEGLPSAIAILISPVLPRAAHGIFDQLNWKMEPELAEKEARFSLADAEWGKLPDGHVVGKPTPFPQESKCLWRPNEIRRSNACLRLFGSGTEKLY